MSSLPSDAVMALALPLACPEPAPALALGGAPWGPQQALLGLPAWLAGQLHALALKPAFARWAID